MKGKNLKINLKIMWMIQSWLSIIFKRGFINKIKRYYADQTGCLRLVVAIISNTKKQNRTHNHQIEKKSGVSNQKRQPNLLEN